MVQIMTSTPPITSSSGAATAPLIPLFAPYCTADFARLERALAQLQQGSWQGVRPVQGKPGHGFCLQWHGDLAPLDPTHCELTFPQLPEVHYRFVLQAYELLNLLLQAQHEGDGDLGEAFWRWLILGDALAP